MFIQTQLRFDHLYNANYVNMKIFFSKKLSIFEKDDIISVTEKYIPLVINMDVITKEKENFIPRNTL